YAAISRVIAVFACILLGFAAQTVRAQSTANYAFSTGTTGSLALDQNGNAIDMSSGTTTVVGASVDDTPVGALTNLNLGSGSGFDFWFMGQRYNQFSATANGIM